MSNSSARPRGGKSRRRLSREEAAAGCQQFAAHLVQALALFRAEDKPLWKRTQKGMMAFKGMSLDNLPPRLQRDIDRRFANINRVLARYTLNTWEDYATISNGDLLEIQRIVRGFALDP